MLSFRHKLEIYGSTPNQVQYSYNFLTVIENHVLQEKLRYPSDNLQREKGFVFETFYYDIQLVGI